MAQKKMSFEESMERLNVIVRTLEKGEAPLSESLALFEEGTALIASCGKLLDEAETFNVLESVGLRSKKKLEKAARFGGRNKLPQQPLGPMRSATEHEAIWTGAPADAGMGQGRRGRNAGSGGAGQGGRNKRGRGGAPGPSGAGRGRRPRRIAAPLRMPPD